MSLPILDNYDLKLDLASSQSVKLLLVNSLYVAAVAAIGMSLGSIIRNSAGGIMSLVGLFFVAPIAFQLIPGDFFEEARKYLPGNTVTPLTAVKHVDRTRSRYGRPPWCSAPGWSFRGARHDPAEEARRMSRSGSGKAV